MMIFILYNKNNQKQIPAGFVVVVFFSERRWLFWFGTDWFVFYFNGKRRVFVVFTKWEQRESVESLFLSCCKSVNFDINKNAGFCIVSINSRKEIRT